MACATRVPPRHQYQFRVVDPRDPEARRTSLVPRPNVAIEKTKHATVDAHTTDDTPKKTDFCTDDLHKRGVLTNAEFEACSLR